MFDTLVSLGFTLFLLFLGYGVEPIAPSPQPTIDHQNAVLSTESAKFVRVVDGDTLKVQIGEKTETIRIIGINTPETVDPRKTVECFGKEASQFAKDFFASESGEIILIQDQSQGDQDKYQRLLRYVSRNDVDYGLSAIAQGYAQEYTYDEPYKKQSLYKESQRVAQEKKLGLWSENACL